MLTIRLARGGRRNRAFFRIVLTENSKPSDSGFIKVLGWYDPHSKKISLQKEEVLQWVKVGAKPSNSLSKLLEQNKVTHKNIKFVPDAKGAPKTKEKNASAPAKLAENEAKEEKQEDVKAEETAAPTTGGVGAPTGSVGEGEKAAEKEEPSDQPKEDKKTSDKISEEA